MQKLNFYSRHTATPQIKKAIVEVLEHLDLEKFSCHTSWQEKGEPFERGFTTFDCELKQDSIPFNCGIEILEKEEDSQEEESSTTTFAGVFPAMTIGQMVEAVQKGLTDIKSVNIITFVYERDRETNTVSDLVSAVVWSCALGKPLEIREINLRGVV